MANTHNDMKINLTKDLCFLDIEATGLNVIRERIIQIAIVKLYANGDPEKEISMLINPGIPISEEAMQVHGITPKDVASKPSFKQVAKQLYEFIGGADIAGYNSNRFDIPILMEEFARCGYEFDISKRRLIDVQRIFYKMEPRTLKAALRFYCNRDLHDAHDALVDVKATIDVFKGQLIKYENVDLIDEEGNVIKNPIVNDIQAIYDFTNDMSMIDPTQKVKISHDGKIIFNFGKYMGQEVAPVVYKDRQYYNWILIKEFSTQVKQIVKRELKEYESKLRNDAK